MKIMITGASGLVSSALIPYLRSKGHEVYPVVRSVEPVAEGVIRWDPERGFIDYRDLDGVDAVINLAGDNIASGRWTDRKKAEILFSRVNSTNFLSQVIASLTTKPKVLLNTSAIGYYGSQGNAILTEKSPKGQGFLTEVVSQWEGATDYARRGGIRTCLLRFGVVLSSKGGALASMLPPFKWGFGGRVGSGKQWWSWIAIDDLIAAVEFVLTHAEMEGPINVVTPFPVTNREFTKTLGAVLGKPTIFPLPGFMARLLMGEMANELLLASQRVEPDKLIKAGFEFQTPKLDQALSLYVKS